MKAPKISIIVPIYNVEKYLWKCLDSISAQTFTDWECLLIDDGSPDNSGAICDEYAVKDTRFKVFHKPNGGVSSARNLGLDMASGEWVTFIDSDDFISPTFLEGLYAPIAKGERLDLVHGGCTNWKDGKPAGINQLYEDYIGDEPDIVFEKFRGLTVSKLFRLETVNHWSEGLPLRFDEKMKIAEDMAFTLDYLLTVKRYAFVSEVGYYYRVDNMTSATKTQSIIPYHIAFHACTHISIAVENYIKLRGLPENKVTKRLSQVAEVQFETILSLYRINRSRNERLELLRQDWSGRGVEYLKFLNMGKLKSMLAMLICHKIYGTFDFITSLIMKLKYKTLK